MAFSDNKRAAGKPLTAKSSDSAFHGILRDYDGFASDEQAPDDHFELPLTVPSSERLERNASEGSSSAFEDFDEDHSKESDWEGFSFGTHETIREVEPNLSFQDDNGNATKKSGSFDHRNAEFFHLQSQAMEGSLALDFPELAKTWTRATEVFNELQTSSPQAAENLARGLTSMPGPGDSFLGFRIVEELGRGAFGQVFLALQGELADRHVALKVSAELPGESQTLAQLQHTNIVPIFSAHHAPPLHAVCMPYFGRATLADLLQEVEGKENLPDSGKALLKTLDSLRSSGNASPRSKVKQDSTQKTHKGSNACSEAVTTPESDPGLTTSSSTILPRPIEVESETLKTIGNLSYVGAVLWMGARIADGLAHAHRRGILHRDLKPANVLMTDDGQPMILDFNLSEDTKEIGATSASAVGTLPYMAPENIERFLGKPVTTDAKSDLYAVGIILYELLTGRHPFELYPGHTHVVLRKMIADRQKEVPDARKFNMAITPAVNSILQHCLESDPVRRYQTAMELHEDLERHLTHFPLKYAKEPSIRERSQKWVRRHPRIGSTSTVAAVFMVLLTILASALAVRGQRLARLEAARDFNKFHENVASVRFLLNHRLNDRPQRKEGETLAQETLRPYRVLDDPRWFEQPAVLNLPEKQQSQLREEAAEVLMMLTQAELADAKENTDKGRETLTRSAQKINQLALAAFPKGREPQAFWVQQAVLVKLLGQEGEGAKLAADAEKLPLKSARDYYLAAAGLASRGEFAKALPLAEQAIRIDPQHFWAYFILGVCQDRLEHHSDAMASFVACTALRPDFAESWLYRGLAHLKRRDLDKARADFDVAARLRPEWYEPYLNRAIALRELGDHLKAENDLTQAIKLGAPETRAYFLRSVERQAQGDHRGAKLDQEEGLKRQPSDLPSWISRAMAKLDSDREGSLTDFEEALKLDPKSLEALQMSAYILSDMKGRDEDTIKMLTRIVDNYPDFAPARSGRGVQYAILGRRDEALKDARESVWRDTNPSNLYQIAGIYATTSKTHPEDRFEAYRLLGTALRAGFGFELLDVDHELDAIRDQPEFLALVDSARRQAKEHLQRPPGR